MKIPFLSRLLEIKEEQLRIERENNAFLYSIHELLKSRFLRKV